ncbi:hypothetical protein BC835DRAFT_1304196 [Cytidiella melzeri]|nr:hypothetical protein BC835DRAFT_1304196 [Cytidiella melzeri]
MARRVQSFGSSLLRFPQVNGWPVFSGLAVRLAASAPVRLAQESGPGKRSLLVKVIGIVGVAGVVRLTNYLLGILPLSSVCTAACGMLGALDGANATLLLSKTRFGREREMVV